VTTSTEKSSRNRVFALSIHADYRCQHSGACCTSDWDVPVEIPLYRSLEDALSRSTLTPAAVADGSDPPLIVDEDLPEDAGAMIARTSTGDCVFYHRHSGLCVIHRDLGEPMLPSTCRQFPRLAVRDPRGTFISLTHYCPTAAASLFRDDVPIEIVEDPPAFPDAEYDGLVVTADEWPPLLHPRMLTDLAGYDAWERHMVSRCAGVALTPEGVIATLERDARLLRAQPFGLPKDIQATVSDETLERESIVCAVAELPRDGVTADQPATLVPSLVRHREVMLAIPTEWRPAPDENGLERAFQEAVRPRWSEWSVPLKRYLAAKAFASWTAYQGRGLLTIVRGIDAALALVRVEAARQCRDRRQPLDGALLREAIRLADYALNHLASGDELATVWSEAEA